MQLIHAGDKNDGLVAVGIDDGIGFGAVHPAGAIDIQLADQLIGQQAHIDAGFHGKEFFIDRRCGQRRGDVADDVVENRHFGNMADVGVDIHALGGAIAGAAFNLRAADPIALQIELFAGLVFFEMIGVIVLDGRPAGHGIGADLAQRVFHLTEAARPVDVVGEIVIDPVAQLALRLFGGPKVAARTDLVGLEIDIVGAAEHVADFAEMIDGRGTPIDADRALEIFAEHIVEFRDGAESILIVGAVAQHPQSAGGAGLVLGDGRVPISGIGKLGLVAGHRSVGARAAAAAAGVIGHRIKACFFTELGVPVQVHHRLVIIVFPFIEHIRGLAIVRFSVPVLFAGIGRADGVPVLIVLDARGGLDIFISRSGIVALEAQSEFFAENADVLFVGVLAVHLRSAHGIQLETVVGVDVVRRSQIIGPGVGISRVDNAVAGFAHHRSIDGELAVEQTAGGADRGFKKTAGADLLPRNDAGGLCGGIGDDVHGAADGGGGQINGTEAALQLDRGGGVGNAVPVGPVHPAVLHVIDRHTVDHDGHVALIKTADIHAGISRAAARRGGVHARRGGEHQRNVAGTQSLHHLLLLNVGERHRGFSLLGAVGKNIDALGDDHRRRQRKIQNRCFSRGDRG